MNKNLIAVIVVVALGVAGWYVWKSMRGGEEMPAAVDTSDPMVKAFLDGFKPSCEQSMKTAMAANPAAGISEDKIPAICDCAGGKVVEMMKQKGENMSAVDMVGMMASPDFATSMQACMAQ